MDSQYLIPAKKRGELRLSPFLCSLRILLHCEPMLPVPSRSMPRFFRPTDVLPPARYRGFTLIELIMVIVIVGILAVFVAPRFFDANVFRSRGFADQVQASLRYAQKAAIAQRRFVCATFAVDSVTLSTGPTAACGTNLQSPTGEASYVINAPANTEFAGGVAPADFSFDALGRPSAGQVINVTGATNAITIEAETGYVH